jgi:hypothetical protein
MFTKFGEAARLYAENQAIVKEMKAAFDKEVRAFFEALAESIGAHVAPETLTCNQTGSQVVFAIGTETKDKAVIWGSTNDGTIIAPGTLSLMVGAPDGSDEHRARVSEAAKLPDCKEWCKSLPRPSKWQLFAVEISYQSNENPVEAAAPPLATILKAITKAYSGT